MRFCCSYVGGTFSYIYPGGPFCCNYADDCFCCNYVVRSFCSIYAGESSAANMWVTIFKKIMHVWVSVGIMQILFSIVHYAGVPLMGGDGGCPRIAWIFLSPCPIKTHTPSWGTPSPHLKMKSPPPTEKQSPPSLLKNEASFQKITPRKKYPKNRKLPFAKNSTKT